MKRFAALVLPLVLLALVAACEEEEKQATIITPSPEAMVTASPEATPSPEVTPTLDETPTPEPSPTPEAVACAADSSERFAEAQRQASFPVFCPTFLPEGFQLVNLRTGSLEVDATFTYPEEGASVRLIEGNLGASFPASIVRLAGEEGISPETTAFGEMEGDLYAPLTAPPATIQNPFSADVNLGAAIIVVPSDGSPPGYVLQTEEVAVQTVKEIAVGMLPVEELP